MIKKQSDNQFVMTSFTFYVGFYTDSQTIIKLCHSQTMMIVKLCHQTQIPNMMKIHRL